MEMSRLIAAIGTSVQEAQDILAQKDLERYMQYFEHAAAQGTMTDDIKEAPQEEENGTLHPKAIRFAVGDKEEQYIDVPVVAMVPHGSIGLKSVKVTVSGDMHEDARTQGVLMNAGALPTERGDGSSGTVELLFESDPQSEGQARATQKLLDNIAF